MDEEFIGGNCMAMAKVIPLTQYEELLIAKAMLESLEEAGVDNWEGYGLAQEIFETKEVPNFNILGD